MKRTRLTHHLGTQIAKQSPKGMEKLVRDFMELMQQKVAHMNPDNILNMDQMVIPFS